MILAPIGLSTYKRRDHLASTLRALAANTLARESELFIFSDAPRTGDEQAVCEVRSLIKNLSGFKKVHLIEREKNDRVANNRGGMKFLLNEFGRMIFLEEDVVTAPAFLSFMNEGLEKFQHNQRVFSICGYTPPAGLDLITDRNVYICRRFSAWGFGMWADRYQEIDMGQIGLNYLTRIQRWRLRSAGSDLVIMVEHLSRGEIEALDVRINVTLAKNNHLVICPTRSLTVNRGHDGTGIHCGVSEYFETDLDDRESVRWDFREVKRDFTIDRALFFYRGRHRKSRKNFLRYHLARKITFGQ